MSRWLCFAAAVFLLGCSSRSIPQAASLPGVTREAEAQPEFSITSAAAAKIRDNLQAVGLPEGCVVVSVTFKDESDQREPDYKIDVQANPSAERFEIVEVEGVRCALERKHLDLLRGTELDYVQTEQFAGFRFRRQDAKRTRGFE